MRKDKPLSDAQRQALLAAENTLYGDTKMIDGFGRSVGALKHRGLVEGDAPHVYLTEAGKLAVQSLIV